MTPERRKHTRNRCLLGGSLVFDQNSFTVDCTIRNLSDEGALLSFPKTVTVPDTFRLRISSRHDALSARMCWSDGVRTGVRFEAPMRGTESPVSLDMARRLRLCENEKQVLQARIAMLTEG